jgi:hypothetical protein
MATTLFPNIKDQLRRPRGKWLKQWFIDLAGCSTIWLADQLDIHHFTLTTYLQYPTASIPPETASKAVAALQRWAPMSRDERNRLAMEAQARHPRWPLSKNYYDWIVCEGHPAHRSAWTGNPYEEYPIDSMSVMCD